MKRRVLEVGTLVRLMRIADGVPSAKLAKELGVSPSYLSYVENGVKHANLAFLRKVADRFKLPLPLLMLGEEIRSDDAVLDLLRDTFVGLLAARAVHVGEQARRSAEARIREICSGCPIERARVRIKKL